ncbi:MAG: PAS domain-containing sensor histidine kinase [Methanolobus sp.]|nr:PAS domain-containing sensor histidine kinase [Methanolobus sp.]
MDKHNAIFLKMIEEYKPENGKNSHDQQATIEELKGKIEELEFRLESSQTELKRVNEFCTERLDNLNDVLFAVDVKGYFTYVNPAIENITGYEIEEVLGTHFTEYVHPDDLKGLLADIERTVAGEHKPYMFRIMKKDGKISYVHTTSRPIIRNGEMIGINGLMVDIARLKHVEFKLMEERDRAQRYLDIVGVIILALDREGNIKLINKKGCELFGYDEHELLSKNWFDICATEEFREKARRDYAKLIHGDIELHPYFEAPIWIKEETRYFAWHNILLKDREGKITGVLSSGNDITERRKAEEALVFAKMVSDNAHRTKRQFLANVSHELRTPLNHIIGYSEILHEDYSKTITEEQKRYIDIIRKSGNNLLLLINSMIELSAIEEGKAGLEIEHFTLPDIIEEIRNSTAPMAKKKHITLEFEIKDNVNTIQADKNKIKTVLYNLIHNGIKFTPEYGDVKVSISEEGNTLTVSVMDTGIGISEDDMEKLFQPFSQIDSSLSRKFDGAGLGLIITKEFVEMHGGNIRVESEVDKGSNFTFMIPIRPEDETNNL